MAKERKLDTGFYRYDEIKITTAAKSRFTMTTGK